MAERVTFAGIGHRAEVDPAVVKAFAAQLFPANLLDGEDLVAWYTALTDRIALVEAALEVARTRRAMVIAHLRDSFGKSFVEISDATKGALSPQRAGQLAKAGRAHITALNPEEYAR